MFSPYHLTRPTKKVICIEHNRIRVIFLLVVEAKSFLLKKIVNFFFYVCNITRSILVLCTPFFSLLKFMVEFTININVKEWNTLYSLYFKVLNTFFFFFGIMICNCTYGLRKITKTTRSKKKNVFNA